MYFGDCSYVFVNFVVALTMLISKAGEGVGWACYSCWVGVLLMLGGRVIRAVVADWLIVASIARILFLIVGFHHLVYCWK